MSFPSLFKTLLVSPVINYYISYSFLLFCSIAFYRLQPSGLNVSTDVSNVYAVCSRNAYCVLCSTITSTELLIKKTNNNVPLNADSDCVVNFVEIIHDCIPRCVNLKLWFASYGTDNLYLQVKNLIAHQCSISIPRTALCTIKNTILCTYVYFTELLSICIFIVKHNNSIKLP